MITAVANFVITFIEKGRINHQRLSNPLSGTSADKLDTYGRSQYTAKNPPSLVKSHYWIAHSRIPAANRWQAGVSHDQKHSGAKENGAGLVILNRDPTDLDTLADLVLHDQIGPSLAEAVDLTNADMFTGAKAD